MNGKQLKNSILQWAIQGKLVPQDPNDEPASVLLEKNRAEKARLVKEGKLKKKDLEVKPIEEDEIPFEIPKGWEWCRLKEVVFNHGQKVPDKEFSYIDIGSIDNKKQKLNEKETIIEAKEAPSRARRIVCFNDIVYSTVRPYLHNMAIINKPFVAEPIASTGFAVLSCHDGLFNKYLFYYLMSPSFDEYANNGDNAKGVAYPAINDEKLYKALVPLPPLAEQHRIVAKIEELLPLVEKYGTAQEALEEWNNSLPEKLKKSILQEAYFGNHVGIPLSEAKEVKLKDVCDIIMGQSPEGNTYNNSNGIEFHQGKVAFGNMFLNPSGVFTTSPTKYAEPDSIVVSVRAPVGTANITKRKICIGRGLACIMPKQNTDLMYIYYLLESPEIREYLEDNATGTTFKAISGKVLQELELSLPPLAEQRRIVAKIEELFGVIK